MEQNTSETNRYIFYKILIVNCIVPPIFSYKDICDIMSQTFLGVGALEQLKFLA